MIEILLIAVSLSLDAFAVSVSAAACSANLRRLHMLRAAGAFGLFQFLMPVAGALAGSSFSGYIGSCDHWIAFILLALVGGHMIVEVSREWRKDPEGSACPVGEEARKRDLSSKRVVLALAVATSLDALAVGMSFAVVNRPALGPSAIIGIVTFALCLFGFASGKRIGQAFGRWAQLCGGLVLIGIGARILVSHAATGV